MCGIVGYVGKNNQAISKLIQGLKKLEYRGYDSAGIAYFNKNKIDIKKCVGRISNLENIVDDSVATSIGIGHTRWATHGKVNTINSHPHHVGNITVVHNGILENYQQLKDKLIELGYVFKSETDTEVLCAYIDYEYNKSKDKDMIDVLNKCLKVFKGSYASCIMVSDTNDKLFVIKKDSPLVIGIGEDECYIASDTSAFINYTNNVIYLNDNEVGVVSGNDVSIYKGKKKILNEVKTIDITDTDNSNMKYEHYMLKEIHEQAILVDKLNKLYLDDDLKLFDIKKYKKIHIIGCGTAYHAGLIGKHLMEKYNSFEINVYIASEYRYQKIFVDNKTLVIFVSQSGETADTLACLKKVKELGCETLGIVNVKNSSIARLVDRVIYTEAGPEVAVASTKAFISQIYIFSLLALKIAINNDMLKLDTVKRHYKRLPGLINCMFDIDYSSIINKLYKKDYLFYLGRNIDYITILEGALKIKEISYIHSEAYQAGELKHGTIALIDKSSCVIALGTDRNIVSKLISNVKEVKSRNAYVILLLKDNLIDDIDKKCYNKVIAIPAVHDLLQPMVNIVPLQLIAYYVAKKRGCDIDKPRNLAKSVTVE